MPVLLVQEKCVNAWIADPSDTPPLGLNIKWQNSKTLTYQGKYRASIGDVFVGFGQYWRRVSKNTFQKRFTVIDNDPVSQHR